MTTIEDLDDVSTTHTSAIKALRHIITAINTTYANRLKPSALQQVALRRDAPYYLHSTKIMDAYILLNRNHKPVGSNVPDGGGWAKYEDYTNLHIILTQQDWAALEKLDINQQLFIAPPWLSRRHGFAYADHLKTLLRYLEKKRCPRQMKTPSGYSKRSTRFVI